MALPNRQRVRYVVVQEFYARLQDFFCPTGLDEEKKVPFHEHVFLDDWLEGVPEKGPVRQFLEIMIISLSKNPYITVQRKKETFEWFKIYFERRHDILMRTGALG